MFELIITMVVTFVILTFNLPFWLEILIIVGLVVFLIPSFYAMFKGAPYVPSRRVDIERMIKVGDFKMGEKVYELGSGDGRVMRMIEKCGAEVVGIEYSPGTYLAGRLVHFFAGGKGKMIRGDFWKQDYGDADALVCFLLINTMKDFKVKIWPKLKKGTRLISNQFSLPGVKEAAREGNVFMYVKK